MSEIIFMIHGNWCRSWVWENYKNFFTQKGFRCVTPTLRYHELISKDIPDPRLGNTSLRDYVEDLKKEISKLDKPPIIMGHSMGGILAQILSSEVPVKAVVLLSTAGPNKISLGFPLSVTRSFLSITSKWGWWKKPMKQTFGEARYSMLNLLTPDEQRDIYNKLVYESGRSCFEIGYQGLDSKNAAYFDSSKITCPKLFIAGSIDRITPSSSVKKVAMKYKSETTFKEFHNHSHWLIGEKGWEDIAQFIYEWVIKSISSESRKCNIL